jgi:hypothetical protein
MEFEAVQTSVIMKNYHRSLKNKDDENRYGSCVKPDLANDSDINEL